MTLLPEPLSPTSARVSPRSSENDRPLDRLDRRRPAAAGEGDTEIADFEKRLRHRAVAHKHHLARVERVAHRLTDKDQQAQHHRQHEERRSVPSQGACRLALPCASISPSDGEPGGKPKPRKSSEVRIVIEPFEDERQKGDRRDRRIRQNVAEDDEGVGHAECARRPHVIEIARTQELGAHDIDQAPSTRTAASSPAATRNWAR